MCCLRYELWRSSDGSWAHRQRPLSPSYADFPVVHPHYLGRQARYIYAGIGRFDALPSPLQGVVKLDVAMNTQSQWLCEADEFVTEASFAPRRQSPSREDDGYLLVLASKPSSLTSDLLVLDAADVAGGPVRRVRLPVYVPYGLHGMYADKVLCDFEDAKRKFTVSKATLVHAL